jgi:hypothetical protein
LHLDLVWALLKVILFWVTWVILARGSFEPPESLVVKDHWKGLIILGGIP